MEIKKRVSSSLKCFIGVTDIVMVLRTLQRMLLSYLSSHTHRDKSIASSTLNETCTTIS